MTSSASTSSRITSVRGVHLLGLVDKVLLQRVFDSSFWKERCFALTPETLVSVAAANVEYVCGSFGTFNVASPFLCFLVKLLQLGPALDVAREFVTQRRFVYLRCLGAFYLRMVAPPALLYDWLEPLLADYRRIQFRDYDGSFAGSHVDVFVGQLLTEGSVCGVAFARLPKRSALEKEGLGPRRTALTAKELEEGGIASTGRIISDSTLRMRCDEDDEEEEEEEEEDNDSDELRDNKDRKTPRTS